MKTRKGGREKDENKRGCRGETRIQEKEAETKMKTRKGGREKDKNKKGKQRES